MAGRRGGGGGEQVGHSAGLSWAWLRGRPRAFPSGAGWVGAVRGSRDGTLSRRAWGWGGGPPAQHLRRHPSHGETRRWAASCRRPDGLGWDLQPRCMPLTGNGTRDPLVGGLVL